jgi:hypothetical protein
LGIAHSNSDTHSRANSYRYYAYASTNRYAGTDFYAYTYTYVHAHDNADLHPLGHTSAHDPALAYPHVGLSLPGPGPAGPRRRPGLSGRR